MMPIEIYIAILVASSCIFLLTVSILTVALYFKARIDGLENQMARLDGDVTGLINESKSFISKLKEIAAGGNGVMEDVGQMSSTVREWTERADRVVVALTRATEPSKIFISKNFKFGGELLSGVLQSLRTKDKNHSLTRRLDMSENNNESSSTRVMAAFGAGALIGVGVALLFAPQSGKEAREMVSNKTHDLKDTAEDVISRGKHLASEVKHEAREVFEKGKKAAHEANAA